MPVIQLPRDTRGAELGSAIAGATKSVSDALLTQQISTGVAQIMEDPAIPQAQKGVKALQQFGDKGYETYKKFVQTNVLESQMKNLLADKGLAEVRTQLLQQQLPTAAAKEQADLAKTLATTRDISSQTTTRDMLAPGQVAQQGAQTGLTQAQTGNVQQQTQESQTLLPSKAETAAQQPDLVKSQTAQNLGTALTAQAGLPRVQAEGELAQLKVQQAKQFIDQNAAMFGGPGGTSMYDGLLRSMGIEPTSARGMAAKNNALLEPDPTKRGEAFMKGANEAVRAQEEINKPQALSAPQEERIVGAERQAASAERFLSAFNRGGAQQTGWLPGAAPVKQFLEQIGVSSGDPAFVEMFNSTLQQVGDAARSGAQFYSSGVLKLAKETTPNIAGSPLHAVMAMNEIAARNIATLEAQKGGMLPGQPKATIDAAIKKWEGIAQQTAVDSYTIRPWTMQVTRPDGSVVNERVTRVDSPNPPPAGQQVFDKNGQLIGKTTGVIDRGDPTTVVLYGGNQVDPKTMKNVLDAKAAFNIKGNHFSGSEIIAIAKQHGVTPEEALARLRGTATAPVR